MCGLKLGSKRVSYRVVVFAVTLAVVSVLVISSASSYYSSVPAALGSGSGSSPSLLGPGSVSLQYPESAQSSDGLATSRTYYHFLGPWAGYTIYSKEYSIDNVTGSWKVPSLTCNASASSSQYMSSLIWVDGFNDSAYATVGTVGECYHSSSTPIYYAIYDITPDTAMTNIPPCYSSTETGADCGSKTTFPENISVTAGDIIYAYIWVNYTGTSKSSYVLHIANLNASTVDTFDESIPSFCVGPSIVREPCPPSYDDSATWTVDVITTTGTSGAVVNPLANFKAERIGMDYTLVQGTDYANVSDSFEPIAKLPGTIYNDTMIASGYPSWLASPPNILMAYPSHLSSDGTSFMVSFVQEQ